MRVSVGSSRYQRLKSSRLTALVTVSAIQRRVGIDVEHLVLQPSKLKSGVLFPLSSAVVVSSSRFRSQIICKYRNVVMRRMSVLPQHVLASLVRCQGDQVNTDS